MKTKKFDISEYLDNEELITEYLSQVLADGDNDEFFEAMGHIAKARGMSCVAKDAKLGRESLYKTFAPGAKPRFETVLKVMNALGLQMQAVTRKEL
jgi:probable addiction module antidote protein